MAKISEGNVIKADPTKSRKQCKKWFLEVKVDGKAKRKRFNGSIFQAYSELINYRNELIQKTEDDSVTFSQFSELWLEYRSKLDLSKATYASDKVFVKTLNYFFGEKIIKTITRQECEDAFWKMKTGETRNGNVFSDKYRLDLYITLNQIFKRAIQLGYLQINPAADVQKPRVEKPVKRSLTRQQFQKLMNDLDFTNGTQAGIALCACLGLRRSEATHLVFGDFSDDYVNIKASKTASGIRQLPLNDYAKQVYSARYHAQEQFFGRVEADTPFVGTIKIRLES